MMQLCPRMQWCQKASPNATPQFVANKCGSALEPQVTPLPRARLLSKCGTNNYTCKLNGMQSYEAVQLSILIQMLMDQAIANESVQGVQFGKDQSYGWICR